MAIVVCTGTPARARASVGAIRGGTTWRVWDGVFIVVRYRGIDTARRHEGGWRRVRASLISPGLLPCGRRRWRLILLWCIPASIAVHASGGQHDSAQANACRHYVLLGQVRRLKDCRSVSGAGSMGVESESPAPEGDRRGLCDRLSNGHGQAVPVVDGTERSLLLLLLFRRRLHGYGDADGDQCDTENGDGCRQHDFCDGQAQGG